MTDEQIFEVASKYLRYFNDGWRGTEYSGKPEELLKFAREIRAQSFADGYDLAVMDYIRDEQYFALRTASND